MDKTIELHLFRSGLFNVSIRNSAYMVPSNRMHNVLEGIWKEVVVAEMTLRFPGGTEKCHEKLKCVSESR